MGRSINISGEKFLSKRGPLRPTPSLAARTRGLLCLTLHTSQHISKT